MLARQRVQAGMIVVFMFAFSACSQPLSTREKGTLAGGGLGAASGAIIGSTIGSPGAGAAIGGAMGALGGGLVGDQLQGVENRAAYQQRQIERQNRELQRQRRELEALKNKSSSDGEEY